MHLCGPLTSRLAAKARQEAEALAAEVPLAGRRRSTRLSRSLRYRPLLSAVRRPWSGSLRKRPRSYAAYGPGAWASTDPGPATPAPLDADIRPTWSAAATGDSNPAQRLSPRPGAGQPLRSGSRANAPRAPLTRQAIQTPRYPGTIFSLTATSTSER